MTPSDIERISKLAEVAHSARQTFAATAYWNTAGLTQAELTEQTVQCELLRTAMMEANAALARAQLACAETV